jgi:DNA-binding CsgD family transcriptional regulator
MCKRRVSLLLLFVHLLVATVIVKGNEFSLPRVRNFPKEEYQAASQNWSVCQDREGIIYVANSIGLLEFDGATWTLYNSPNGNIIRAVAADSSGRIFTSGYRELGFWVRNPYGKLEYTSLTDKANEFFTPNVEYWNISIFQGKVIFQSFTQLLIYENDRISAVNFRNFVNSFFIVDGKIMMNVLNEGIYEWTDTGRKPFLTGSFFNDKSIRFMLSLGTSDYLIGTDSHGVFRCIHGEISEWGVPLSEGFRKNQINRGCLTSSGNVLIGTILDGVYLLDREGALIWKLNAETGLQNNTVLGMLPDGAGNIWLALDRGIDLVSATDEKGVSFFPVEKIGAVYTAAVFKNQIFLGTNQGLYMADAQGRNRDFTLIPGTQGQVWDLKVINNQLIAGHNTGTFLISEGKAAFISRISGAFSIISNPLEVNGYLQCTYSNLVKYKAEPNGIQQTQVIYNFNELIRFIEFDHLGNLWGGHMHRGIYKLRFNDQKDSVKVMRYYGRNSVFGKENNLHVFKVENRIAFTTGELLYTYDDLHDTIVPFDNLNSRLGEYKKATRIIPSGDHNFWFITSQSIGLIKIVLQEVSILKEFPYALFNSQLIHEYENIIPVSPEKAIICLENGYAWLDGTRSSPKSNFMGMKPQPHEIYLTDTKGKEYQIPLNLGMLKIPYQRNSLSIRWAFPYFPTEKITFQWNLEGLNHDWSDQKSTPLLSLTRLPPGKYTLKGRVTDLWGNESLVYSLPIVVLPPLYWSLTAKIFYVLLFVLLLVLFRIGIIRKIEKKELRKREENEKELISLKNEKLQADISYKSKELASSAMAIISKNKILTDLKEMLQQQKSELGSRFPGKYFNEMIRKIEETLSSHDDWKVFETNFEQTHEMFMKNLKTRYPDLTPKDIRICAFLRMNLSSKEIAPLLGISIRAVENHRYRLRQKMNLSHHENLIEIILNV